MKTTARQPTWIPTLNLGACALLALWGAAACGAPEGKTTVIIADAQSKPRLDFEDLRLLSSPAEVIQLATDRGWKHTVSATIAPTQQAIVAPTGGAVERYELTFEDDKLINLYLWYREPDLKRSEIRHHYAMMHLGNKGAWSMADGARQTLVTVGGRGQWLHAIHTGQARDRVLVDNMFSLFFRDNAASRPAVPPPAPLAVDP